MANAAADCGSAIIIFPELSLTGYSRTLTCEDSIDTEGFAIHPLVEVAQRRNIVVVAGAPLASDDGLLIASLCFLPNRSVSTYTKQYLHDGEEASFVAGDGGGLIVAGASKIGLAICAEINEPCHVRETVELGATVYAASCFFTPAGYGAETSRLQQYAQAHDVVVMMANFVGASDGFDSAGGSAIWDESGQLLIAAPSSGESLVVAERKSGKWDARLHI